MLVLSRRPDEEVLFPELGIAVRVIRTSGKAVRLGITAPRDVRVLRSELATLEPGSPQPTNPQPASPMPREQVHSLRNALNTALLRLTLLQRKLEMGRLEDADTIIQNALRDLESVDAQVAGSLGEKPQPAPLSTKRVLVVDDNRTEAELLAGYLQTFNYQVDLACDGLEAIQYLEAHDKPDIVLLDMQMPRLDGAETIRRIRANPAFDGIRVFAVSGMGPAGAGVPLGSDGVDQWITKPFKPKRLLEEIQESPLSTRPG